jgi:hypothetical protein
VVGDAEGGASDCVVGKEACEGDGDATDSGVGPTTGDNSTVDVTVWTSTTSPDAVINPPIDNLPLTTVEETVVVKTEVIFAIWAWPSLREL